MYHKASTIKKLPSFMRPREKLIEKGASSLHDYEIISVLLRSGFSKKDVFELSEEFLSTLSLHMLQTATIQDITKIKGIGISGATSLLAAVELGKRVLLHDGMPSIVTPEDALNTISFIKEKRKEYFVALYLNARRQLITTHIISIGSLDMSIAHPREVFEPAIRNNASAIIIAHNHPSGDPQPSNADIMITRRLVEAGSILDIQIHDHLIVAQQRYISFSREDLL